MTTITPSFVNTYLLCPAKAYFQYVLRLPRTPTPQIIVGRAMDLAIGLHFAAKMKEEPVAVEDAFAEFLEKGSLEVETPQEALKCLDPGVKAIRRYISRVSPLIIPTGVQVPTLTLHTRAAIRGRADVTFRPTPEPRVSAVADVKTASRRFPSFRTSDLVQLTCYTHTQIFPIQARQHHIAQIHLFVLKKDPEIVVLSHPISESDVTLVGNLVASVLRGVSASAYPPNRDAIICSRRHCPFWRECQEYYGGTVRP